MRERHPVYVVVPGKPSPPVVTQTIDHPAHYQSASPIGCLVMACMDIFDEGDFQRECIDWLEENPGIGLHFLFGNAIKYLWRAGQKGDLLEDLNKALWYLDRFIDRNEYRYKPYMPEMTIARDFLKSLITDYGLQKN
jgi:Protein of unknwon function (DUF3310)